MVRLAHFSVREYLTSERILLAPDLTAQYSIREISANLSIAEICLAYLLQFDKPELTKSTWESFPLARYAAEYWIQHAAASEEGEGLDTTSLLEMEAELFLTKPDASFNWTLMYEGDTVSRRPEVERPSVELVDPLCIASQCGGLETVRLLIKAGANVNARSRYPYHGTPLQVACKAGHYQVVRTLLNAGAEVNAPGNFVDNALMSASRKSRNEIVQLLLTAGADPGVSTAGTCPLWLATYGGDCHIIYLLIDYGADVNWCDINGNSLLRLAIRHNKIENARVLEENGAIDYGMDCSDAEWEQMLAAF